jgi:hypothetical protein
VPMKIKTRLESEKYLTRRKGLDGSAWDFDRISGILPDFVIGWSSDTVFCVRDPDIAIKRAGRLKVDVGSPCVGILTVPRMLFICYTILYAYNIYLYYIAVVRDRSFSYPEDAVRAQLARRLPVHDDRIKALCPGFH